MGDKPVLNLDGDEVNANWTQILHARHEGRVHPLDPNPELALRNRVVAQRQADQEREQKG
jgi:hypothetical protein